MSLVDRFVMFEYFFFWMRMSIYYSMVWLGSWDVCIGLLVLEEDR